MADLLNRFLGDYVENLNKSQLKLGIWGGKEPLPSAAPCPPGRRSLRGQGAGVAGGGYPVRGSRAVEPPAPLRGSLRLRPPVSSGRVPGPRPSVTDGRCVAAHVPAPSEHRRSLCARGLCPFASVCGAGTWAHGAGLGTLRARKPPTSIKPLFFLLFSREKGGSTMVLLGLWAGSWRSARVAGALGAGAADGVLGSRVFPLSV